MRGGIPQASIKSCDKADFFGSFLWLWEGIRAELRICEALSSPEAEFLLYQAESWAWNESLPEVSLAYHILALADCFLGYKDC